MRQLRQFLWQHRKLQLARFFQFAGAAVVLGFDFLVFQCGGGELFDLDELRFKVEVRAGEAARQEDRRRKDKTEYRNDPQR